MRSLSRSQWPVSAVINAATWVGLKTGANSGSDSGPLNGAGASERQSGGRRFTPVPPVRGGLRSGMPTALTSSTSSNVARPQRVSVGTPRPLRWTGPRPPPRAKIPGCIATGIHADDEPGGSFAPGHPSSIFPLRGSLGGGPARSLAFTSRDPFARSLMRRTA